MGLTGFPPSGSAVGEAEPRGDPVPHPGHHREARPTPQRREGQTQRAAGREAWPRAAPQSADGGSAEQDGRAAAEEAGGSRYPPAPPPSARPTACSPSPTTPSVPTEVLSDEDKLKMSKIKKKMRRKVGGVLGEGWGQPWEHSVLVADVGPSPGGGGTEQPPDLTDGYPRCCQSMSCSCRPPPGQEQAEAGGESSQSEGGQEEIQGGSAAAMGQGGRGLEGPPTHPPTPGSVSRPRRRRAKRRRAKRRGGPRRRRAKGRAGWTKGCWPSGAWRSGDGSS